MSYNEGDQSQNKKKPTKIPKKKIIFAEDIIGIPKRSKSLTPNKKILKHDGKYQSLPQWNDV